MWYYSKWYYVYIICGGVRMTFEEAIKEAMLNLSKERELWIIEELKPCFDYDENGDIARLKESYRFKFQEIQDFKQKTKDAMDKLIDNSGNLMSQNRQDLVWAFDILKKELGLE